jgi:hypothetical protein
LVEWVFRAGSVCRACELTARDQRKQRDPWLIKAHTAIRSHAARLGIDREALVTRYGWDPQRLAHDAEHHYTELCTYCPRPYAEMGHGLSDITLDVQDRDRPPYYRTNTAWCCQTCNRRKGVMTPEEFEADLLMWDLWNRSKNDLVGEQGMLF